MCRPDLQVRMSGRFSGIEMLLAFSVAFVETTERNRPFCFLSPETIHFRSRAAFAYRDLSKCLPSITRDERVRLISGVPDEHIVKV